MTVEFSRLFLKDLDKITLPKTKADVSGIIEQAKNASSLSAIKNLKKLKGHPNIYRIRSGDYRIGISLPVMLLNLEEWRTEKTFTKYFLNRLNISVISKIKLIIGAIISKSVKIVNKWNPF